MIQKTVTSSFLEFLQNGSKFVFDATFTPGSETVVKRLLLMKSLHKRVYMHVLGLKAQSFKSSNCSYMR